MSKSAEVKLACDPILDAIYSENHQFIDDLLFTWDINDHPDYVNYAVLVVSSHAMPHLTNWRTLYYKVYDIYLASIGKERTDRMFYGTSLVL